MGEVKSKYVLESDSNDIEITAYDKVGNKNIAVYSTSTSSTSSTLSPIRIEEGNENPVMNFIVNNIVLIVLLVLIAVLIPIIFFVIRKIVLNRVNKA
jgi:hypothetical protein